MKTNPFNICPTCIYENTCVLTNHKDQVWSCSDYEEICYKATSPAEQEATTTTKCQPELALA